MEGDGAGGKWKKLKSGRVEKYGESTRSHCAAFGTWPETACIGLGTCPALRRRMALRNLFERTEQFSIAVFNFCRKLPKTREAQEPADQLRRAANGVRMNYRAARRGRSHAEFKAKLGVVFEEADEAADWLRYFRDTGMRHEPALVQEGEELAKIFAASVATARKNSRRLKNVPQR